MTQKASAPRTRTRKELTAIVGRDGSWHVAYCPDVPGANGQGVTRAKALQSLADAIALITGRRGVRLAPVRVAATALERLVVARRAIPPRGDLRDLGAPKGRPSRRARAALRAAR